MTTHTTTIRPLTLAEYQALVTGIPKNCPNATFGVAGQTFTAAQAVTFINTVLSAVNGTVIAKAGWKDAMIAEDSVVAQSGATVRGIRDIVATMFSNNTAVLAEFMITPRKPYKPLSAAARAAANAKAAATRAARGTKGKVQKAAITGDVTGVTITPVVGGATGATGASGKTGAGATGPTGSASGATGASASSSPSGTSASGGASVPAAAHG